MIVGDILTGSLGLLTAALVVLTVRGFQRFRERPNRVQLAWSSGLALAAAAMAIETIVYAGVTNGPLLAAYVFLSAAIVGVLSLGAVRVLHRPRLEAGYAYFTLGACAALAVACAVIPLDAAGMVSGGIITGNPPLVLLVLSTLITGPATVLLLLSAAYSLRRTWRWQTMLMIAGALVLGAGGTLYIASFPIALYYAEFLGIVLLFLGLISLPKTDPAHAGTLATTS